MVPYLSRHHLSDVLLIALCSLVGISQIVPSASAIQCHQCNSALEKDCDDVSNHTVYLKACKGDGKVESEAFCRKSVQKVLLDGNTRVIRACGWERSRQACYRYDDDDHSEVVCECTKDGCNSSPGRLAALLSLTLLPSLLVRL